MKGFETGARGKGVSFQRVLQACKRENGPHCLVGNDPAGSVASVVSEAGSSSVGGGELWSPSDVSFECLLYRIA